MKYVFFNDLYYLLTQKYKIIVSYILTFIIFYFLILVLNKVDDLSYSEYYLNNLFGLDYNPKELFDVLKMGMLILNYAFYVYLSLLIVLNDLDNIDNLFLRIKTQNWITCKLISSLIISLFINTIIYLFPLLYGTVNFGFYLIIIKKTLIILIINMIILLLLLLYNKNKIICFIIFLLSCLPFFFHLQLIIMNIKYLIIINFILFIIICEVSKFIKLSYLKEAI